jgi:transcriptional regulator with XRE-family HTH domain
MYRNIDFEFASSNEICEELGSRLRACRLAKNLQQDELAKMAGVSKLTIINLERKGTVTLRSLLQVARALGLIDELSSLFKLQPKSIAMMESIESLKNRNRASKKDAA